MEAYTDWHPPIDCQYVVDDFVHLVLEALVKLNLKVFNLRKA
jgi:hypothetical protein